MIQKILLLSIYPKGLKAGSLRDHLYIRAPSSIIHSGQKVAIHK